MTRLLLTAVCGLLLTTAASAEGWATSGVTSEGQPFSIGSVTDDIETDIGLFGMNFTDLNIFTMQIPGASPVLDTTWFAALGDSDSYGLAFRAEAIGDPAGEAGFVYYIPIDYTDGSGFEVSKPIHLIVTVRDTGDYAATLEGHYPLPFVSDPENYQLVFRATYSEQDTWGFAEIRHPVDVKTGAYLSIGAANRENTTVYYFGAGASF